MEEQNKLPNGDTVTAMETNYYHPFIKNARGSGFNLNELFDEHKRAINMEGLITMTFYDEKLGGIKRGIQFTEGQLRAIVADIDRIKKDALEGSNDNNEM